MDKNLKIALILSATDRASAVLGRAFTGAQRHAKALERTGKAFSEMGDRGLIAGGAITALFGKTIHDARESEIAQKKLIQGFKTMGFEAAKAQQAIEFAGQQQFVIGIEDEQIEAVQGKLATFARTMSDVAVKNDIYNRATVAAFDMQAKGFGDALSNINQLGKALQNPALGATALAKAGTINKEDLPGIKFIQQTKGIGAAQLYLMQAIEKQVKGTAAAAADPLRILQLEFYETSESIGKQLLPEVNRMAKSFSQHIPKIMSFVERNRSLILTVAKAAAGLLLFSGGIKLIGFAFSGISSIVKGGSMALKGFQFVISNGGRFTALAVKGFDAMKFGMFALKYHMNFSIIPALKSAGLAFIKFGATLLANPITWYVAAAVALGAAVYFIIKNWDKIAAFFSKVWEGVKQAFVTFFNWGKTMFLNFTPAGLIIKHWSKLASMFTGVWDKVKAVFVDSWNWLMNLGHKFYDAGKNLVNSIWRGMKELAMKPVRVIANITAKIRDYLPFSPAKAGALRDIHRIRLVETIAESMTAKPLIKAWSQTTQGLFNQMNQTPAFAYSGSGGGQGAQFNLTINLSGSATAQDAGNIYDALKPKLDKWWREKQHQAGRIGF